MKKRGWIAVLSSFLGRQLLHSAPKFYIFVNRINSAVMRVAFKDSTQNDLFRFWDSFEFVKLSAQNYQHLGDQKDGGYILATPISSNTEVVSIGLGDNLSFDFAISPFVEHIHMWDHTIEAPQQIPLNATYHAKGLARQSFRSFFSLEDMFNLVKDDNRIILKIDIEGAEWEVLNELNREHLNQVDQLVIEYHDLFEIIRDREKYEVILNILRRLSEDFFTININPNNWGNAQIIHGVMFADVIEVSYLRKKLISPNTNNIFSSLGFPNNPNQPRLLLENFKDLFG